MDKRKNNRISHQDPASGTHFPINREYKDRLFCKIFDDKKDLLELYNAVNETDYTNPDSLEVNTLDDVIYLGMRNDKSFLIDETLNLYEHNSTQCPNLPLRGLLYFSRLYEGYVETKDIRIYGRKQIHLPTPQYVVFYNGTSDEPDRSILRLSDAYKQKDILPALECTAVMLNINYGHNTALMEKCRNLRDYAVLISEIRQKLSQGIPLEPAVADAVDECIRKGILHDILVKNKVEVISMILTSFDQEEYEKTIRDESYEEGLEQGIERGLKQGLERGLEQGLEQGLERGRNDGIRQVILSMLKKGLSIDEIKDMTDVSDEIIEQVRAML